jgi:mannose/fructose/N-acetylgalactosamine-specific phosphotransferase system component IIB
MERRVRFLRIDDRLVHGQVIVGWLPFLGVPFLSVGNEKIAVDEMRQEMMGMSVPADVSLKFFSPADVGALEGLPEENLVLVASPRDAWLCLQGGLRPEALNIGGMHAKPGKIEVMEAFHADDEDRDFLARILALDVVPFFQPTPQNDPVPLTEIL